PRLTTRPSSSSPVLLLSRLPPRSTPFPYTTLFRSEHQGSLPRADPSPRRGPRCTRSRRDPPGDPRSPRSAVAARRRHRRDAPLVDRKSTRLNSSHVKISYAVFCLKKKNRRQPIRYS